MNRSERRAMRSAERTAGLTGDGSEPLREATVTGITESQIQAQMLGTGWSRERVIELMKREGMLSYWINSVYQVCVDNHSELCEPGWTHLNIRRRDGKAIMRDWRHFQLIKNQLCGEEREAVELYPHEDRVVDTSNKYHLWVAPRGYRFPFGWDMGMKVIRDPAGALGYPGSRQRIDKPQHRQQLSEAPKAKP